MELKCRDSLQRLLALVLCVAMLLPVVTPKVALAADSATGTDGKEIVTEGVVGSNKVTTTNPVNTKMNSVRLIPFRYNVHKGLMHHGRYAIMDKSRKYILSYDAISNTGEANYAHSLIHDQDGDSENTFYFVENKKLDTTATSGNQFNRETEWEKNDPHWNDDVIIEHSDRDTALWLLRQYYRQQEDSDVKFGNYTRYLGKNFSAFPANNVYRHQAIDKGGSQLFYSIELQKGRFGTPDATVKSTIREFEGGYNSTNPGNTTDRAMHGYYWYTPPIQNEDGNWTNEDNKYFTHLCYRSDSSPFKNEKENMEMVLTWKTNADGSYNNNDDNRTHDYREKYRFELFEGYKFLIYFVMVGEPAGKDYNENGRTGEMDYRFLYCDENGYWSVRRYTNFPADGAHDFSLLLDSTTRAKEYEDLVVYLYEYDDVDESANSSAKYKHVQFSGYDTYDVVKGVTEETLVDAIQDSIVLSDTVRKNQHIPGNGMTPKVGYYYLKKTSSTPSNWLTSPGSYTLDIYYRTDVVNNAPVSDPQYKYNSDGTYTYRDVYIKSVTVNITDIHANGQINLPEYGMISLGSSFSDIVYEAVRFEGNSGVSYDVTDDKITIPVPGGLNDDLKVKMLYTTDGTNYYHFNATKPGVYENVQVFYGNAFVDTMTIIVHSTTITPHMPKYPAPGSVKVDKGSTTSEAVFANSGVADIWLSSAGKSSDIGVDLLFMVDLSVSMRKGIGSNEQASVPYFAEYTFAQNPEWVEADWQKTRMYAMEQTLRSVIDQLIKTGSDIRVAIADFGDDDHYEFADAVLDEGSDGYDSTAVYYRSWPFVRNDTDKDWDENEYVNHLNYVFGTDTDSRADKVHYWKYWSHADLAAHVNPSHLNKDHNGIFPELRGKMPSKVYTGNVVNNLYGAFVDVKELYTDKMDDLIRQLRISNSKELSSNYDLALETAYKIAYERKEQNIKEGVDREIIVIMLSDGAPTQYNYFSGTAKSSDWISYLKGELKDANGVEQLTQTTDTLNSVNMIAPQKGYNTTYSPYGYFYNTEGQNWWANAIKGSVDQIYPVINMFARDERDGASGREVTDLGTKNRSHYNGVLLEKNVNGTTTYSHNYFSTGTGLALDNKDYISGFEGLGLRMYTVGFGLVNNELFTADLGRSILKGIADNMNCYFEFDNVSLNSSTQENYVNDISTRASTLGTTLKNIAQKASMGSSRLWFTDTMGDNYELLTYNRRNASNQTITPQVVVREYELDANGNRTGNSSVIETITFGNGINSNGKVAYSNLIGSGIDIWDDNTGIITGKKVIYNTNVAGYSKDLDNNGETDVLKGDIVNGEYKIDMTGDGNPDYRLAPETFFWTIGDLPVSETVLEYKVYLTGSMDNNISQEWKYYDTNEEAILHYIDARGNNCVLYTNPPKFPWGNGATADLIVVDYGIPVTFNVRSNDEKFKSGNSYVANLAAVSALDSTKGIVGSATTTLNDVFKSAPYSESVNTTVKDKYGTISFKADGSVTYTLDTMDFDNVESFVYALKGTSGSFNNNYYYGTVTIVPATTLYFEDSFVSFKVYQYHKDNSSNVNELDPEDPDDAVQYAAHKWTTATDETDSGDENQHEDRPGVSGSNIYGYDQAYTDMSVYSLGSSMKFTASEDNGLCTYGTAEFDFSGTGFDVISLTSGNTGTITVQVFELDEEGDYAKKDTNGRPIAYKNKLVDTYYGYTYGLYKITYTYTKGQWVRSIGDLVTSGTSQVLPEKPTEGDTVIRYEYCWVLNKGNTPTALYQVPVMKIDGLPYNKYRARITVSYAKIFDHAQYTESKYDFYLDAIRIYDPANDGVVDKDQNGNPIVNETIKDAYIKDNEGWPEYFELRNLLISENTFNSLNPNDATKGIVFIDGNPTLSNSSADGSLKENDPFKNKSAAIRDYMNFGPNNELYLAPGQAIAFDLNVPNTADCKVTSIQLALKSVGGSAKVKVYDGRAAAVTNILPNDKNSNYTTIATATDLYYNITDLNSKTVVISNAGLTGTEDAILSITNIKITYSSEHKDGISDNFFMVNQSSIGQAVEVFNDMMFNESEEDSGDVVNGSIDLISNTLSFEDEILVNLYYSISGIDANEMGLLTWSSAPVDGTIDNAEHVMSGAAYDAEKDRYMVTTPSIPAKNLGDDIYMCVYAKTDSGIVYSDIITYSPKQYAYSRLAKSTVPQMQKLCVAMLNYGAAAQTYFGYKTDALVNADLSNDTYASIVSGLGITAYDSSLFSGAFATVSNEKLGEFKATTNGFVSAENKAAKSASVSFDGAFAINYYFRPSETVNGDVTFYYWSSEDYASAEVLSSENATGTANMVLCEDGRYWMDVSGIAAQDIDDAFYAVAIYSDGTNTFSTGVIPYSVSKYCVSKANGGNDLAELAQATAMYGYSAKLYFNPVQVEG